MTAVGEDDEVAVQPFELGAVPSAKSIRRFTSQAANSRGGASIGSLLGGVYYAVISIAIRMAAGSGSCRSITACRAEYAPSMNTAPWARFTTPNTPNTKVNPSAKSA